MTEPLPLPSLGDSERLTDEQTIQHLELLARLLLDGEERSWPVEEVERVVGFEIGDDSLGESVNIAGHRLALRLFAAQEKPRQSLGTHSRVKDGRFYFRAEISPPYEEIVAELEAREAPNGGGAMTSSDRERPGMTARWVSCTWPARERTTDAEADELVAGGFADSWTRDVHGVVMLEGHGWYHGRSEGPWHLVRFPGSADLAGQTWADRIGEPQTWADRIGEPTRAQPTPAEMVLEDGGIPFKIGPSEMAFAPGGRLVTRLEPEAGLLEQLYGGHHLVLEGEMYWPVDLVERAVGHPVDSREDQSRAASTIADLLYLAQPEDTRTGLYAQGWVEDGRFRFLVRRKPTISGAR